MVGLKMTEKPEWGSYPLGAPWSGPWQSAIARPRFLQ